MSNLFEPEVTPASLVSGPQGRVQGLVANYLQGFLSPALQRRGQAALGTLLEGAPTDMSAIENYMWRGFKQNTVPAIRASAANIGGTLSTRLGKTVGEAATDVQGQIGTLQAQLLESARQRQLGAIGALMTPLGIGAQFSTSPTRENIVQPGMGGTLLSLVGQGIGTLFGGGMGGMIGSKAGADLGNVISGGPPAGGTQVGNLPKG